MIGMYLIHIGTMNSLDITLLYQQNKAGKTSNSIEQILPLLDRLKMIVIEDRVKKAERITKVLT
jgi:hypothetical protein